MRISLRNSNSSFSAVPGRPLLEAARGAGLPLPRGCLSGNCGACRARLLSGNITYPNGRPLGLSDAEMTEGLILLCQARAEGDLLLEATLVSTPEAASARRLPCRIERIDLKSHDVAILSLRLPAAEPFVFEAGQYIDVLLPGGRRRSFSIASPPHASSPLDLHVRRVEGGEFTAPLFASGAVDELRGTLLSIEGPLGRFVYRQGGPDVPLLLIGGGTGLAPLHSILRHVIDNRLPRTMILYWGVRSQRDLYAHDVLESLRARAPSLRYIPVLSEPSAAWRGRRGWVHDAVLADLPNLAAMDIYASGPPAMVDAVGRDFAEHGADIERLWFDSFDYAADSLDRQRSSAASKS